jgi:hypothetical protein
MQVRHWPHRRPADNRFDGLNLTAGQDYGRPGNLITANASPGIDVPNSTGTVTIDGNTISGNGTPGAGVVERAGIIVRGGAATTTISHNVVSTNISAGVLVAGAGAKAQITQNSIFGNAIANAGSGLGIDLVSASATEGSERSTTPTPGRATSRTIRS